MICGFFYARKSCFQDFKSTVKDKVSLLNRYLFPAGQNGNDLSINDLIMT